MARLILMTPGPVELHPRVLEAQASPVISHRSESFRELYMEVVDMLRQVYVGDELVALVSGSGTTAVDSMVWSLLEPGEKVLALSNGEFGDRLASSARRRGAEVHVLRRPEGQPIDVSEVSEALEELTPSAILAVHNETSTGYAARNLKQIAARAREAGALVLVDSVSGLGGEPLKADSWMLDAVASASHKCIAAPPGISFVYLGERALEKLQERRRSPPPSLDLKLSVEYSRRSETPFTPPVTLLYALREALEILLGEGVEARWRSQLEKAREVYEAAARAEAKPIPPPGYQSATVAAIQLKAPRAREVIEEVKKAGYLIASGMGELREKAVRVGLMGAITLDQVRDLAHHLEKAIRIHCSR